MTDSSELRFANYAVCYVDLLGQRDALKGQALLPEDHETPDGREKLIALLKKSIGSIVSLQQSSEQFVHGSNIETDLFDKIPEEHVALAKKMKRSLVQVQRWSDGLMLYTPLTGLDHYPINSITDMIIQAGALCYIGLAKRSPLRGGMEIGWAVELHKNELYGSAVARSYELENYVAGYPRIVLGNDLMDYIISLTRVTAESIEDRFQKGRAEMCLNYINVDTDGRPFINYLSERYVQDISGKNNSAIYGPARKFVVEQLAEHMKNQNSKLAFRYATLLQFFDHFAEDRPA